MPIRLPDNVIIEQSAQRNIENRLSEALHLYSLVQIQNDAAMIPRRALLRPREREISILRIARPDCADPPGGRGGWRGGCPGRRSDANSPRYSTDKSEPVILSDSEA
jgi:hypothetical protein